MKFSATTCSVKYRKPPVTILAYKNTAPLSAILWAWWKVDRIMTVQLPATVVLLWEGMEGNALVVKAQETSSDSWLPLLPVCELNHVTWFLYPDTSVGKESACSARDPSLIPGLGRSPGEGIGYPLQYCWASLVAQLIKNLPARWETWVQSLGWEDSPGEGKSYPLQ